MLHPSTKKLIDKLNEMTRKQRVAWIEGEDGSVVHDTEGYRVVLTAEPHGMLLTDALGREIETCRADEFADEKDPSGRPYAQFVGELYREAHRHARGAERAIRTLLAGLEAADEKSAPAKPAEPAPAPVPPDMTTDDTAQFDGETEITAAVATMAEAVNRTSEPVAEAAPEPEPEPASEAPPEPEAALKYEAAEEADKAEEAPPPSPAPAETEAAPASEAAEPVAPAPAAVEADLGAPNAPQPAPVDAEPPPPPAATETAAPAEPEPAAEPESAPAQDKPVTQAAPSGPMQQRFSLSGIPYTAPAADAETVESAPEPKPVPPRTLIIDGTEDLPDIIPGIPEPRQNVNAIDAAADGQGTDGEAGAPGTSRFNPWN